MSDSSVTVTPIFDQLVEEFQLPADSVPGERPTEPPTDGEAAESR